MSRPAIYMTATKVSDWDDYGDHKEENGWISPEWSMTEVYENFNDVSPVELFDNESDETYAQWVTRIVQDELGIAEWDGGMTFYAVNSVSHDWADSADYYYALHVIGIDNEYWTKHVAPFVSV